MPLMSHLSVHAPLGAFESFLLRGRRELVAYLMNHIEIQDLFVIGRLNVRIRYWFFAHCQCIWDFSAFALLFSHRPKAFLALLDLKHTVLYGKALLQFFFRCTSWERTPRLNICTTMERFCTLQQFLHEEGYTCHVLQPSLEFRPAESQIGEFVRQKYRKRSKTWTFDSDESSTAEDLDGTVFTFHKVGTVHRRRSIAVHLVCCEPHRHVLSRSNSASFSLSLSLGSLFAC